MMYMERIRALREDSDYNQTMVARAIHVVQTAYSDYEKGKVRIEKSPPARNFFQTGELYYTSYEVISC